MQETLSIEPRGERTTRLDTFVDAAFAFALTLLVISFDALPGNLEELNAALKASPAFAASFAQLAMFWLGHRHWSRHYGLENGATVFFSLLLVLTALIYVYPLRVLYGVFFEWASGGWLASGFTVTDFQDLATLFCIYGLGFFLFSASLVLLYAAAWRARSSLELTRAERMATLAELSAWIIIALTGLLSALLAVLLPLSIAPWSGATYSLLAVLMPLNYAWFNRRLQAEPAPG